MKGYVLALGALLVSFSSTGFAFESKLGLDYKTLNPYDVVLPALNGDPSNADKQAGQMYLDIGTNGGTTGRVRVIGKDGEAFTISNGTGTPVSSGTVNKIERAKITNNGTCSESVGWIQSISRPTQGMCEITFTSGTFSAAPSCVCTANSTSQYNCSNYAAPSATGVTAATISLGSSPTNTDSDFEIICMGPS